MRPLYLQAQARRFPSFTCLLVKQKRRESAVTPSLCEARLPFRASICFPGNSSTRYAPTAPWIPARRFALLFHSYRLRLGILRTMPCTLEHLMYSFLPIRAERPDVRPRREFMAFYAIDSSSRWKDAPPRNNVLAIHQTSTAPS